MSLSPLMAANVATLEERAMRDGVQTHQGADAPRSPLADRVVVAAADQVIALQLRPRGQLHELLKRRLSDSSFPTGSVWLALGEQLVPSEVAHELQSLGAVGWSLWPDPSCLPIHTSPTRQRGKGRNSPSLARRACVPEPGDEPASKKTPRSCDATVLSEMPWPEESYLVHWTRRRSGPWPEQPSSDFLDDMLLARGERSHSAFAALVRIVRQQRLIASSLGIRGASRVVSFSATPLSELPQRRTFRRHRGRWDFEWFGLCVLREWLEQHGSRPVIYGDESEWPELSDADRPFWQLRQTRARGGAKTIDWSAEVEWRIHDDLDLSQIPRDAVLLFAPSEADARQLAAISPWPVVVVGME